MRNLSTILLAVALMLGLAQCKKEQPTPQSEGNVVTITLNVEDGNNNGSRVNVDPTGENQVTFTDGDQILVASGGKYVGTLTKNDVTFSGTVSEDDLVVGEPLYFYFLGNKADVSQLTAGSSTTCTVNISDQTGYPNLPVISMGRSIDSQTGETVDYVSEMTSFTSRLYNKCSLMKFNVTTLSTAAICITGMNNTVTVDFTSPTGTDNGFTYDQVDGGLITIPGVASSGASTWAIVLPQAALTTTGGANSVYTTDGYSGVRPTIHAIERNCYYSDGDDDVDLTVETRWFHTFTATLQDYTVQSEPNRAITTGGVKTFAAGETMAIVYKNTSGSTVKVTSEALTAGDISNNNKSATFTTFELENPDMTQNVTYVYPASMVNDDGSINYDALNSQNGTLTSNLDLATYTGAWDGASLPTATLTNQLAILALTLKDSEGTDITNTITRNLLSDGTNSYNVTRSAAEGPIYVAVRPTSSATISMMAQGSIVFKNSNSLTGMTLEAGKIYPINVTMTEAFLADALNEGVKVNVVVKYNNENWSVVEGTYSSGSFINYVNGDGNGLGTEIITSLSMSMDGDNLVVYLENPYDNNKITFTFNTTDNTYRKVISSNDPGFGWCFKDLKSISINGFDFSNQMTDSDAPVAPTLLTITIADNGAWCGDLTFYYLEGESWKDAIDKHLENAGWGYEIGEDTGDPEMPPVGRVFYNYDDTDWDLYDEDYNPIQPEEGIDTDKSYYIGW